MDSNTFHNRSRKRNNFSTKDTVTRQALCDEARNHIKAAINAKKNNSMAPENISKAITIINRLKENSERSDTREGENNLANLFTYMVDRLSIKYNTQGIDPLEEVNWLLDSLKYIFRNHHSEPSFPKGKEQKSS